MMEGWKDGGSEEWNSVKTEVRQSGISAHQYSIIPVFHSSARKAGFSLLEVLVALAIFGIAAGGILVALGHHLKNVSFLQDHSRAVRIASREMNAMRRMPTVLEEVAEGSEDRFSWRSLASTDGLDEWPGLTSSTGTPVRLSVTVQWRDSEGGPATGKVRLDGFEVF